MRLPSEHSTWTLITQAIQNSIVCSCSFDIYVMLPHLCFKHSHVPLYIAAWCVASCVSSSNALKSVIIKSGCCSSRRIEGPMKLGFADGGELRGAARSAREGKTLQGVALFS